VKTTLYPGIEQLISDLKGAGIKLAVLSNKPHESTLEVINYYFPERTFDLCYGQLNPFPTKPDPALALHIAQKLGVTPQQVALIGDSGSDMLTAVRAHMTGIGVLWVFAMRRPEGRGRNLPGPGCGRAEAFVAGLMPKKVNRMKPPAVCSKTAEPGAALHQPWHSRDWSRHTRMLWLILLPLPFLLRKLLAAAPEWVEQTYIRHIFPLWSAPFRTFSATVPFSLTELAVVLLPVILILWMAAARRAVRTHRGQRFFRRSLSTFGWIVTIAAWQFMLLHGIAYTREPVSDSFGLPSAPARPKEVADRTGWTARLG